ncbi:HEAT repeat domain-containing protein [Ureibacillus sp. GCM10028918]|uniref:HEAT repeat domain-containing protein n=1 Tax=Ureibacillus sp. GCM10028918 TaxID=3273429 RepID=UPI0036F23EA1
MINAIWLMIWLITVCIGCFILLSLHLLWKKHQEVKREKGREIYKKRTQLSWHNFFLSDGPLVESAIPIRKEEIEGYEELSYIYVNSVTSELTSQKLHDIATDYLRTHYKKLLNSPRKGLRLKALARIEDYGNIEILKENNWTNRRMKTKEERLMLLLIYSRHDETAFIEFFLRYESDLTEFDCRKMFKHLSKLTLSSLISLFRELELHSIYALIDTLSIKRELDFIPFLKKLVNSNDREVRIRAAKALYTMRVGDEDICLKLVECGAWVEKLMAAKLARYVKSSNINALLFKLLEDRDWKVREQAARTIVHHNEAIDAVEQYIESSSDQYTVEIIREIIKREGSGSWIG